MAPPSYELFEELGRGESTVVYRGYDLALTRDVAVKELQASLRKDPRRLKQFVKEASFLAQFEHENILRIHSVDQERGWIVMELMKGNLASQVREQAMPADTVRSVMRQILGALDFLHKKNKVHGAVRASNILINDVGTVKLSDFEATDVEGELRAPTGSKKHMAPELIRSEFGAFGPTTDLYCLGFTALELLAGPKFTSFFPGTGDGAIDEDVAWLRWHSSEEALPPIKQLCQQVPDDLAQVIDRLLSKYVVDRPQSAAEVLELLSDQAFIPVVVSDVIPSISTTPAAPTPPTQVREIASAPALTALKAPNAAPKSPVTTTAQSATTSKNKLNDFLEKPYVLWPLCASMLIGALLIGLKLQGNDEAPLARVRVIVTPDDANIMLGDEAYQPDENGLFAIEPGAYNLIIRKDGFETHSESLELKAGLNEFPIVLQAVEKTPPALTNVRIRITPDSSGAEIFIDANRRQPDSDGQYSFAPGKYNLRVIKEGYQTYEENVLVTADTSELLVSLTSIEKPPEVLPELAEIRLHITPDGKETRIAFDGTRHRPNRDGLIELEPKLYQVTVERDGFEKYSDTLIASPGLNEVTIRLQETARKTALLRIDVSSEKRDLPPWDRETDFLAKVVIDSETAEKNVNGFYELEPGTHEIEVSRNGYQTVSRSVTLSPGENKHSFSLIREVTELDRLEDALLAAYNKKMRRPEYVAWKSKYPIPREAEPFPEEATVKRIRSQMTELVELPPNTRPISIPATKGRKPQIDGKVEYSEGWNSSKILKPTNTTKADHDPKNEPTILFLVASKTKLYLGVVAAAEVTTKGFDSVGFFYHRGVSELMKGEHVFVNSDARPFHAGIRQTTIPFRGQSPQSDSQRWMNFPISEWRIYAKAKAKSSMTSQSSFLSQNTAQPHRHYELELDLAETGIHPGVPFQGYIQVETDPMLTNKGEFAGRQYLGTVGSDAEPAWFIIEP